MRIFISADMEGISGVAVGAHVQPGHAEYQRMRRLMTADVNAAVQGALDAGAEHVVVSDGHGPMTNLLIEELHPAADLISGSNRLLCQMEGIDDPAGFDAVFLVGYHQREGGGDGILNHTLMGRLVYEVRLNGEPVDEAAINGAIAGAFGVPVALVTGDDAVCADAESRFEGVLTAPVKQALDRVTARSLGLERARALIQGRAGAAVEAVRRRQVQPYRVEPPVTFEVDFKRTACARACTLFPGVERRGPRTVAVTAGDVVMAFKQFWGCLVLGLASEEGLL